MARSRPVDVLCIYRVKKGRSAAFRRVLARHWPALRLARLATARRPVVWRAEGKGGEVVFIETFQWRDQRAVDEAHRSPEVMAVWGPMGPLCTSMEFLDTVPVKLP